MELNTTKLRQAGFRKTVSHDNCVIKGEEVYRIKVRSNIYIEIRSSVGENGYAKVSGEDSIRCSLLYRKLGAVKPLGKVTRTNRTEGWDRRLKMKLLALRGDGYAVPTCDLCGNLMALRKGKNGDFYGCTNYPKCKNTMSLKTQESKVKTPETPKATTNSSLAERFDELDAILEEIDAAPETLDQDELDLILAEEDAEEERVNVDIDRTPNSQQLAYIQAPINDDVCVLAGPGSGKTFGTIKRIVYLINNGVDPSKIVYVTYTKAMATEGLERILAELPEVTGTNLSKQICTIHAFCYRILKSEGDNRRKAETWKVKRAIEELVSGSKTTIGEFSKYDLKPGWKEVLQWINFPKMMGVPDGDIQDFYYGHLDTGLARKTASLYFKFNARMRAQNLMMFSDMLYDVEQRLLNNRTFRLRMQSRFTHILVDEAQDVNQQALRLLSIIAQES